MDVLEVLRSKKGRRESSPGMTFAQRLEETRRLVEERKKRAEANALGALAELGKQRERTEATMAETRARLSTLETGSGGRVSKAERAAAELDALVERDLDRRPTDERGRPRTREMALLDVVKTRRGSAVVKGIRSEGRDGDAAVRKVFDMDQPPEPERTPTGGERTLEEMAKALAKAEGITREKALSRVLETDQGRAAYASHRVEVAART